jgi:hypothetical protein
MTERFDLSAVIIYCAKRWEGASSAAAPSIISCAIASIGVNSFTGGQPIPASKTLSSTKEREAPQVCWRTTRNRRTDDCDQWPRGTGCELAVEEAAEDWRNSISPASRRNATHSASFGMVLTAGSHLAWRARRGIQGPVLVCSLSSLNNCLDQL